MTHGGGGRGAGRRPTAPVPFTDYRLSLLLEGLAERLDRSPPLRPTLVETRALREALAALKTERQQWRKDAAELAALKERYDALAVDWNEVLEALLALGLDASRPFSTERWRWAWGELSGDGYATAGQAIAAAIAARLKEE